MADKVYASVISLSTALTVGSETITELKLEKPKAKHLREISAESESPMSMILDVAGACAGLPPSVMDEIEAADAMKVVNEFGPFVMGGLETGASS